MKFGLGLHRLHAFGYDPAGYARIAKKAEEVGFESIWIGDHLVFPEVMPLTYPYSETGKGPAQTATVPWLDPFITITWLAAATEHLRFGTDVFVLPLRDPFVVAKSVATLDMLTGGRMMLGVGVGWLKEEFETVGLNFHNRGRRCDEQIDILKALWTESVIEYQGEHYSFGRVNFEPKPAQHPRPPIFYGGISDAAIRRAGERCDGWIGMPHKDFDELGGWISQVQEVRRRAGRDSEPFEMTVGSSSLTPSDVRRYEDLGITRLNTGRFHTADQRLVVDDALNQLEEFGETVLAKL